jgi:hypothetical protein
MKLWCQKVKCSPFAPLHYHFYDTFVLSLPSSKFLPQCKDPGNYSLITVELVTSQALLLHAKQMICCTLTLLHLLPYTKIDRKD